MEEQTKSPYFLYGIIAFLLFLLSAESGLLIFYKFKSRFCPLKAEAQDSAPNTAPAFYPKHSLSRHASPQLAAAPSPNPAAGFDNAIDALEKIQDRMNRLFDTALLYGPPAASHLMSRIGRQAFDFEPAVDIQDDGKNYVVKSDLPGLDKNKINITVTGTQLTLEGTRENISEKKDEKNGFYTQERSYGAFSRSLTLPGPVDETKIAADYKNGVLTVILPKAAGKSAQKVAVQ